ncbi:MAG TPA: hypothetical protein VFJ50_11255 [Gemmatimonadales bacterium]|nr:hypothetical protein [Gemmatimonadales bacterium]
MWFGMMWWWLIPLLFFAFAGGHRRRRYWRDVRDSDRGEVAELRRKVDEQRGTIEDLEGRLARVEDGLEFAERLLAERSVAQPS